MHGKPVTPAWCELGETAEKGSDTIIVKQQTNWKVIQHDKYDSISLQSKSLYNKLESKKFNLYVSSSIH